MYKNNIHEIFFIYTFIKKQIFVKKREEKKLTFVNSVKASTIITTIRDNINFKIKINMVVLF